MDDAFEIPVEWKGEELLFPSKLLVTGYMIRIEVDVNGTGVLYERDEEGSWRALMSQEDLEMHKWIDVRLVKAIAESIDNILQ